MHMLLKDPNEDPWAGNFVYDKKVKEGQHVSDSGGKHYALVPGYPGVMYSRAQPSLLYR